MIKVNLFFLPDLDTEYNFSLFLEEDDKGDMHLLIRILYSKKKKTKLV